MAQDGVIGDASAAIVVLGSVGMKSEKAEKTALEAAMPRLRSRAIAERALTRDFRDPRPFVGAGAQYAIARARVCELDALIAEEEEDRAFLAAYDVHVVDGNAKTRNGRIAQHPALAEVASNPERHPRVVADHHVEFVAARTRIPDDRIRAGDLSPNERRLIRAVVAAHHHELPRA